MSLPVAQDNVSEQQLGEDREPNRPLLTEQKRQETIEPTTKKELLSDTPEPTTSKRTAPKFPSPSECSKWLMLFWFAGFPIEKIRWLLSQYFRLDPHKAYNVENIELTFRRLQKNANRNNPDYNKEPYMYYIMTSKSSSPFEFRQSATRWLEKHHPVKAEEMTEDGEVKEMAAWYSRWCEEVRLMEKSKVSQYLDRAEEFERKLDFYAVHFDTKGHVKYFEEEASQPSSRHSKKTATPSVKSSSQVDSNIRNWGDNIPVRNIDRPQLTVRTKFESIFSRSKQEGTPTPSSAQHLDDLGFFARRPKRPSPGSIIEPRTRTPSLSSTENSNSSKTSLQVPGDTQRWPSVS